MKLRNIALAFAVALSLPIAFQSSSQAQDVNLSPSTNTVTDTQANIDMAKDRLEKAQVRLSIAQKQVEAAKARLKAADCEFKAAKANHDARNLEHHARKLSDASGLPEISENQIEQGRSRSIATKQVEAPKVETPQPTPVDLSKTRLKQVDFNAQPEETPNPTPQPPAAAPAEVAQPEKQAVVEPAYNVVPMQQVATTPMSAPVEQQPPIVP